MQAKSTGDGAFVVRGVVTASRTSWSTVEFKAMLVQAAFAAIAFSCTLSTCASFGTETMVLEANRFS